MNTIDKIFVDISVVLGSATMPVHQLLRMGRGAVIVLSASEEDDCVIMANSVPVAKGQVILRGERIGISITEMLHRAPDYRGRSNVRKLPSEKGEDGEAEAADDGAESLDSMEAENVTAQAEDTAAEDAIEPADQASDDEPDASDDPTAQLDSE